MPNEITADTAELVRFAADLGKIAGSAVPKVDEVTKKAVQNIKDEMVEDAEASKHFKGIGRTLDYDRAYSIGYVGYELGPNRDRGGQAALAGVAYTGGANGGGGTLDADGPLEHETPRFMAELDRILGRL